MTWCYDGALQHGLPASALHLRLLTLAFLQGNYFMSVSHVNVKSKDVMKTVHISSVVECNVLQINRF